MIAIIFLTLGFEVWQVANVIVTSLIVFFIVDMVSFKNKENRWWVALIVWGCIYLVDIYISRETFYWLDGQLAYVFTAFNLLIYFYYLYKRLIMKSKFKKYDLVLLPIVAFFAGWSGPQSGSVVLVMTFLLFAYAKFIRKEKIKKQYYISFIIAIIGFLFYYLAPGNNARLQAGFPEIANLNKIQLLEYRLESVFNLLFNYPLEFAGLSFYISIIFAGLIIISLNMLHKDGTTKKIAKNLLYISCFTLILFIISTVIMKFNLMGSEYIYKCLFSYKNIYNEILQGTFRLLMLLPYVLSLVTIGATLLLALYIAIKFEEPLLFISISCGFLGQIIMLLAPYSPIRTTFISLVLFWIAIAEIGYIIKENKFSVELIIFTILLYFGLNYVILGTVVYLIIKQTNNEKLIYAIALLVVLYFAIINCIFVSKGYYENKKINKINIERLENFDNKSNEIKLLKPIAEKYGFTKLTGIQWIEEAVKEYYNIPQEVKFIEE